MLIKYANFNHILTGVVPIQSINTLELSLEQYVKSQLHFPVTPYLENSRSLADYVLTYNLLFESKVNSKSILALQRVNKWFYQDLGNSLIKLEGSPDLKVVLIPDSHLSLREIKAEEILRFSDKHKESWKMLGEFLLAFSKSSDNFSLSWKGGN